MKYLIDTNWVIDCLKGKRSVVEMLLQFAAEAKLAISIITYGEVYEGAYYSSNPESHLQGFEDFLEEKEVLGLDIETMERFAILRGALRREGAPLGDFDLLIAATALRHGLTLATRNREHFRRIEGLDLLEHRVGGMK